ncbi:hypothetical protein [Methanofollis sp. UBA420]|uniref:hypothetical protein n=1 Tax=Methanofollis sp. UBA420 TaxID=1915514 RepID=UPI00316ACBE6
MTGMSVWTACYLGGLGIGTLIRAAYGRGLRERGACGRGGPPTSGQTPSIRPSWP